MAWSRVRRSRGARRSRALALHELARVDGLATRSLRIDLSELGERAGVIGAAYRGIEHRLGVDAVDRELERRLASGSLAAWT